MIAARKLYLLLCAIEEHLTEAADEHRTHADHDPPGNEAARLLAEIEGHPEAPIPWCDATRGLLARVRHAKVSAEIDFAIEDEEEAERNRLEAERIRESDEESYRIAIGRPADYS